MYRSMYQAIRETGAYIKGFGRQRLKLRRGDWLLKINVITLIGKKWQKKSF